MPLVDEQDRGQITLSSLTRGEMLDETDRTVIVCALVAYREDCLKFAEQDGADARAPQLAGHGEPRAAAG